MSTQTITSTTAAAQAAAFHPELSEARRWAVLICFVLGAAMCIMSQTTMTASMASITAEFGVSSERGQWLTTSYMLATAVMIPCTGFLMTRFQSRHLFLAGTLAFLTGILGCVAPSFWALVAVRAVQGLAGGMLIPLMQVVAFRLFPPARRGFAMGVASLALTAGPAVGPTLAGVITDAWGWRAIFLVVALATLAIAAAYPCVRAFREETAPAAFDAPSVPLVGVGLAGAIIGVSNLGSANPLVDCVLPLLIGAGGLVLFARRQLRLANPLLNLEPFRTPAFTLGALATLVVFGVLINVETFTCLYVQDDQGFSPTQAGLVLLPSTIVAAVISPFTGRVLDRRGPLPLAVAGYAVLAVSGVMHTLVGADSPLAYSVVAFALRGVGNACILQHLQTWAVNSLPAGLMTHGTAIANTLRQVGGALMNSLFFGLMGACQATGASELAGIKLSFGLSTLLVGVVGAVVIGFLVRQRRA